MTIPAFLIEYKRRSGAVRVTRYPNLLEATQARLKLDEINNDPDLEIVAIGSKAEASLRRSHARYFYREDVLFPAAS